MTSLGSIAKNSTYGKFKCMGLSMKLVGKRIIHLELANDLSVL